MNNTFTKYVPDKLAQVMKGKGALIASRIASFANEDGVAYVSNEFLCDTFGITENTLREHIKRMEVLQIWHRQSGNGRGGRSTWKKGANFESFFGQKGCRNCAIKGAKNEPLNKNIEKEKENARALARENSAAQRAREREAAQYMYFNGDISLQPQDIDRMIMLRYNKRIAYCEPIHLNKCLAAGAVRI